MLKKRFLICLALLVALLVANLAMIQAANSSDLTFTLNSTGDGYIVSACKSTATGTLSIPSTYSDKPVVEIGREAFLDCTGLTSVTIPDSVKTIGWYAFSGCTGLTSVTIPDSVTTLDWFAFANCTGLTNVTVGNGVTCIDASAFAGCTKLTTVSLGNGVTSIGWSAFKGCTKLSSINIPHGVTSIDRYAFYNCSSLSAVTYCGTSQEWSAITKGEGNDVLNGVTVTYHKYTNCVCSLCKDNKHIPAPAVKENEETATCKVAGSYDSVVYCSSCKTEISRTKVTTATVNHYLAQTSAAVPATCVAPGKTAVLTCTYGCGYTEGGVEIPATGSHTFVGGTCSSCGATEALTDANLVFYKSNASGGDLRLNNDIRVQFMVRLSNLKDYERIYLEIVHKGATTPVEKDADSSNASLNRYFFVVPAAEMTMDMLVTVCGEKGGVTYRGETLTFSVSNCINVKMAAWKDDSAQANMMKLAMALLNYGEKAQINFGINPDKLATAGLTQEYLDLIPAENPALAEWPTDGAAGQVTITNHGLILKEKVNVVLVLKNTAKFDANASVEIIHHRSKEGDTVTYTYNSSNATISGTNARIVLDKLAPAQLRDTIEIVVKDGSGNAISATYQRSVPMIMNQSNYLQGDAKQVDLVYAIMKYADAAKLAFG